VPPENSSAIDTDQWGRLVEAVAIYQDRAAFAALFEFFAPRVKALMIRSGASGVTAEELAQETLLAVWRKARLFDRSRGAASAWIFAIARNLRIDAARRERRGLDAGDPLAQIALRTDDSTLPDFPLAMKQTEKRIRAALAKLSEGQMRVVELSFYGGKAHAEIAQILCIPTGTVKSRMRLAMNRLRSLLIEFA
jgi:RNA polymerase sigma-70 factor (ECF subfamily)